MDHEPTTINKLIELPSLDDPKISPNGKYVAYTVTIPDWEKDEFISHIYLVATDGKSEPRQLTFGEIGNRLPRWSPDSQYLIFLSERNDDEGAQIYRLALAGGEAERLTTLKTSISRVAYAPDGDSIAFVAVPPETPQQKKRRETYGDYKEDNVDYQHSHLWLLTLADKKVTQLTSGDHFHVRDFVWNPDSQRLAVNAMPAPDMGTLMETRIYLLDVRTFSCDPITPRRTFSPCWSPDGTQLVYERGEANSLEGAFYKNSYLEIISLHDGSTTRVDTAFDENMNPLKWVDDGIYFYAFQRTSIRLFLVTENDWTIRSIVPDEMDDFVAMRYSFTADGSFCAVIYATTDHSTEVGIIETTSGTITTLTDYDAPTREWQLAKHEIYTWESSDGTPIEGILTKPHDFDPSQKYPLLVITHGGPTWISLTARLFGYERRLYPIQQWVAQGAVVLQPNYRGSAGYGEAFRSLNVRELGIGDYADVISGVDALVAEGFIDETRMGKMGWSQGGYISAFTTTYSNRFAAVSVGAGISNWMTYYVNTDIHPFTINYLQATPWDDPEIYAKTSPMTYIKQANTPTLIQHGEKDARVPLPNAYELHQGLLDQEVESKLVVYPGMGHGPTKPKQVLHIMTDNWHWFNRYIFGEDTATQAKKPLYIAVASSKNVSSLVVDVYHQAERDDAHFVVVGADGALYDTLDDAATNISIKDVAATIDAMTNELGDFSTEQVILFSEKIDENRTVLAVLGCLQVAASRHDDVMIEHRIQE